MQYVIGGIVAGFAVALAIGALTGRVKARSCCTVADPARDRRMRAAAPELFRKETFGPTVPSGDATAPSDD